MFAVVVCCLMFMFTCEPYVSQLRVMVFFITYLLPKIAIKFTFTGSSSVEVVDVADPSTHNTITTTTTTNTTNTNANANAKQSALNATYHNNFPAVDFEFYDTENSTGATNMQR